MTAPSWDALCKCPAGLHYPVTVKPCVSQLPCCEGHPVGFLRMPSQSTYYECVTTWTSFLSERVDRLLHQDHVSCPRGMTDGLANAGEDYMGKGRKSELVQLRRRASGRVFPFLSPVHRRVFPRPNDSQVYISLVSLVRLQSLLAGKVAQR